MKRDYKQIYFYPLFIGTWLVLVSLFLIAVISSNGLAWKSMYFNFSLDSFMDFGNSIRDGQSYDAYSSYRVIYPAICNLIFRFFALFFPKYYLDHNTFRYEIRNALQFYPIFIFFIAVCYLIIFLALNRKMRNYHPALRISLFIPIATAYPILYTIERGNILLLSVSCLIGFALLYKDDNKVFNEIALILLAISISVKIYPVIFAAMVAKNKNLRELTRLGIYCVLFFFLPFIFYGGMSDLILLIKTAFSYFSSSAPTSNSNIYLFLHHFGLIGYNTTTYKMLGYLFIILFTVAAFFIKEEYLSYLCLGLAVLCVTGATGIYCASYLLPAIIVLILKHKVNILEIAVGISLIIILTVNGWYTDNFHAYQYNRMCLYMYPILYALVFIAVGYDIYMKYKTNKEIQTNGI